VDLRAARDVNNGFGDGLATAFELVFTPMVMAFFGWLIDRALGTHLVFALGFGLFTFGYLCVKLALRYNAEMAAHDAEAPWARRPVGPTPTEASDV
jgi:F0F1-type ATP synthase assembly protein I